VEIVEDGPLSASIRTKIVLALPAWSDGEKRSSQYVDNVITSVYTLRRGCPRVDVTTTVANSARDHCLRAIFPTGLAGAEKSCAWTAHDVVERDIHVPDTSTWREPMTGRQPSISFVDVSDGQAGLALMHKGLIQYEVIDRPDRAIALTLLRAHQMRNLARIAEYTDQVDSQLLGETELHYSLYPHGGFWSDADVVAETGRYLLAPLAAQAGRCAAPPKDALGREHSFLRLSPPNVLLAALKRSEDAKAVIARVVNPEGRAIDVSMMVDWPVGAVEAVLADETTPAGDGIEPTYSSRDKTIRLKVPPKKIVTLRISSE
jgi:alpha-mannosidase